MKRTFFLVLLCLPLFCLGQENSPRENQYRFGLRLHPLAPATNARPLALEYRFAEFASVWVAGTYHWQDRHQGIRETYPINLNYRAAAASGWSVQVGLKRWVNKSQMFPDFDPEAKYGWFGVSLMYKSVQIDSFNMLFFGLRDKDVSVEKEVFGITAHLGQDFNFGPGFYAGGAVGIGGKAKHIRETNLGVYSQDPADFDTPEEAEFYRDNQEDWLLVPHLSFELYLGIWLK